VTKRRPKTHEPPPSSAVAYVRVSTEEQANEGVSLAAQEARIRSYCAMRGLDLVEVIIDAGVSGGKHLASRDGGERVLELVRGKKVAAVVSLKLDRLFRNAADCLNTVETWDRAGVSLHLVDMGGQAIDTSGAMGRFFLTLMAGVAELERNQIRERTSAAMRHMAERGLYTGGEAPMGNRLQEDGTLVEVEEEREALTLARRLHGEGMSLRAVSAELAEQGHVNRRGRPFHAQQVARMVADTQF
jgi:DNA invertase Pin-like site-specific DNA recombinase